MNFSLQTTRKISFSAFILCVCLLSAQTAFSQKTWQGGSGTAWSTGANWVGGVAPVSTDDVIIIEGAVVNVTATTSCQKLTINGSTSGGQGKVTVDASMRLTVGNANTATTATVIINGGIIDNKGELFVVARQALDGIRFDNGTGGTPNSTYMGTGLLNCNTSTNGTGGGGNSASGSCVTFAQTTGTATFELSSTGTYTFSTGTTLNQGTPTAVPTTKSVFYCPKGTALINGTGMITIGSDRRSIRVAPNAIAEMPNLTIGSGVTMNLSSTMGALNSGMITVENNPGTGATSTSNLINKGKLNFSGAKGNPIALTNGTNATTTSNFSNEGEINIEGTFTDATANLTWGGIFMGGGNTTVGNSFTNTSTGKINFNITGTSAKPLFYALPTPKNLITNISGGTITIGTNGSPTTAFQLGDDGTTVNNAGTITVGEGDIVGTTPGNAAFNNSGTLDLGPSTIGNFVTLKASANQTLANLTVNGGGVTVDDGMTLTVTTLTLTSGHITLGTGNVVATTISGGSLASHIVTNGTGTLTQSVTSAGKLFPIGQSATSYDPVTIKPASTIDFGARVGLQTTALGTRPTNSALVVNREWDITGTAGTTDLTFTSLAANKDGSTTRPGAVGVIGHYNTATSTWDANIAAVYAANTWGVTGYTGGFSPFIVASPGAVLSAELLNITVKAVKDKNIISWATATETNNKGFDVERQTANGTWETLGFVKGTGKAATYTFEDKTPLSISYYRLRQIDFDGKETLSKVISVSQDTKSRPRITPNPTSDKVTINLNQNEASNQTGTVILSDMTGRQVLTQTTTAGAFQLDLSHLAKGMYLMTVQSNNAIYQEKIIRQ